MMKSAALTLTLLILGAFPAYAYTDKNAGYSINDHNPEAIVRSSNLYAFTDQSENSIAVHTYTAAEVEALTGVKFSTDVFLQEYEKLALLQRSQLSLKTLPIPLLEIAKYQQDEHKIFLSANTVDQEANIRIDKLNKLHVITLCYPANEENMLSYVSFASANDMLYIITFWSNNVIDGENSAKADTDIWQQYWQSLRTFKTSKPIQSEDKKLQYYDAINKNTVDLPADWVYAQTNFKDKYDQGCLTVSLPLSTMRGLIKIIQQNLNVKSIDDVQENVDAVLASNMAIFASKEILQQEKQTGEKIIANLDETLVTASLKVKDSNCKEWFVQPEAAQIEFAAILEHSLQRLKYFNDEYFTLNDYEYFANVNSKKALVKLNSNISLYKQYNFNTSAQVCCTPKDKMNFLLYLNKQDKSQQLNIADVQAAWQF